MSLTLRPGRPEDASMCGTICYEAFKTIAEQHNFPTNYPSSEAAIERMVTRLMHPGVYAVVAELDGRVVGSNFLDERSGIAGLGPITVAPAVQNHTIGRHLMQDVLDRATARHYPGVRLVLASYHARALSLYAKLGFTVRDVIARVTGAPLALHLPGYTVRPATLADLDACNQVCQYVHGHDRSGELQDAMTQGSATVVEHEGRLSGYATMIGASGHAVGRDHGDRASTHWGGTDVRAWKLSRSPAQWGAVSLVSHRRLPRRRTADTHELWFLSGASGGVLTVDTVLDRNNADCR